MILNLDVDFPENLLSSIMYEPQSLHWHHDQVSVQSQILKVDGEKSYNPYFFDSLRHDQVFVKQAMDEMVKDVDLKDDSKMIIIKTGNCTSQY